MSPLQALSPSKYHARMSLHRTPQEIGPFRIDVAKKTLPVKGHFKLIHCRAFVSVEKLISSLRTRARARINNVIIIPNVTVSLFVAHISFS